MLAVREKATRRSCYMEAVFLELCRLGLTDEQDREVERVSWEDGDLDGMEYPVS